MLNNKKNNSCTIEEILSELKCQLKEVYKDRLVSIILYGSYARGEATEGSDIDILVVLKECPDSLKERGKIGDIIWDMDLKYNTVISVIAVDADEFNNRRKPFFLNVKREGVAL